MYKRMWEASDYTGSASRSTSSQVFSITSSNNVTQFFIHLPVEHLYCFQFSVIINKICYTYIHSFLWEHSFYFFGMNTQEWIARSYAKYMFNFIVKLQNVSKDVVPLGISTIGWHAFQYF